jgi:hypothetical protein
MLRSRLYKQPRASLSSTRLITALASISIAMASSASWAETPTDHAANVVAAAQIAAEQAVKEQLRDPNSANFDIRDLRFKIVSTGMLVCGTVNAKNGFGGYTGKQNWIVLADWASDGSVQGRAMIEGTPDFWPSWRKVCRKNRDGISEMQKKLENAFMQADTKN